MKFNKTFSVLIMAIIIATSSIFGTITASSHNNMLDVIYDDCIGSSNSDGIDEMWYALDNNSICRHISHEEYTIKYYFEDDPESDYTWTTDVSDAVAEDIRNAYADSMKKWNNIYFYSYNSDGTITKNKLINIVEGTETDHNLSIYPTIYADYIAATGPANTSNVIETGTINHYHCSEWEMTVNLECFYVNDYYNTEDVALVRERTGAHEIGHILGLRDVDTGLCNSNISTQHHHEVLMGYGTPLTDRTYNITYKDIAGVAITRGLHTDSNHKWLNCGQQSNGTYKLICSICNGIKMVENLSEYLYSTYNLCNGNHTLTSGNMMAVASYGTQDYYKCRHCRYVAPFSSIINQNYYKSYVSNSLHKCVNYVSGLEYTFYESHQITFVPCNNNDYHLGICECGYENTTPHIVTPITSKIGTCIMCGASVTMHSGTIMPWGNDNTATDTYTLYNDKQYITENGSYILPNGVIVLAEEDVEIFTNGTLTLYHLDPSQGTS